MVKLCRGQILPANTLHNTVDVELIADGTKYKVQVCACGVFGTAYEMFFQVGDSMK